MSNAAEAALLGRIAIHYKLVTPEKLQEAIARQTAMADPKKKLGEVLLEMKLINKDQLTWLLNAQAQMARRTSPAQAAPAPAAAAPAPAAAAPAPAAPAPAAAEPVGYVAPVARVQTVPLGKLPSLEQILSKAVEAKASDVHIHAGAPLQMRVGGTLRELKLGVLDADATQSLLFSALSDEQRAAAEKHNDLDFAIQLTNGRFRANIYRQQRGWDGVFRPIPAQPPTLESLGLPKVLERLVEWHQGLVLITGPAGCGKSSTLAALVNLVNGQRHEHVITVEDPIEFVHPSKKCVINQRQANKHTKSFANALRAALREDPDVIVIGELRDLETISLAITAAETGHLVLGTLHTNSAIRTINRVLDVFPPKQQSQIRAMVSESLKAIVSQRLVPSADGNRRVPALETLFVKPSVSNLIRDEKTFQIRSVMQTGKSEGMALLDDSLLELVKAGTITKETARRFGDDPKRFA
ncbi:MAG: type IV pilus twitching motility protein PilT [Myxococcaceae bacterium]|nr:type IV pilus twitching motility protein PilT [Myxococcaceae bacterium]